MKCINQLRNYLSLAFTLILIIICLAPGISQTPSPGFVKSFSPATIGPGSTSNLTFTITNNANTFATDIAFTDPLPAGLLIASPANATTNCGAEAILIAPDGGNTITLSNGRLGKLSSCTVSVHVTSDIPDVYNNVTSNLTSSVGSSDPATAELTVDGNLPGFSKSFSPNSILVGGTSTLTFTIDNSSGGAITSISFSDDLPAGIQLASPDNFVTDCQNPLIPATLTSAEGNSLITFSSQGTANFPALAAESTCTVSVDVIGSGPGSFLNVTNNLVTNFDEGGFATAEVSVLGEPDPLFTLSKTFILGAQDRLKFEFGLDDNNGRPTTTSAEDILFSDDLENTLTGLTATGLPFNACGGTVSSPDGGSTIEFSGGMLQAGESCSFFVDLDIPPDADAGDYLNTTSPVSANDGELLGNPATAVLTVAPPEVNILFDKVFSKTSTPAGSVVDLTFRITHDPEASFDATALSFSDDLNAFIPGAFTPSVFPISACGGTVSTPDAGSTVSLSGGSLTPGEECSFTVQVSIPGTAPVGPAVNTSTALNTVINGSPLSGDAAVDDIFITTLTLTKEFTDDPVLPEGTVTLAFTLENDGADANDNVTNIFFTDNLDDVLAGLVGDGIVQNVCGGSLTWNVDASILTFSGGSLNFDDPPCTFSVDVTVPANAEADDYTNITSNFSATINGVFEALENANDQLTVTSGITELIFSKSFSPDNILPGDNTTLTFSISNENDDEATGISFTDEIGSLIPGSTVVSVSGTCGGGTWEVLAGEILSLSGGNIGPNGSCSLSALINVPAPGSYENVTSELEADVNATAVISSPASANLNVYDVRSTLLKYTNGIQSTGAPGIALTVGAPVTWDYVIKNNQGSQLTIISLVDDQEGNITASCPVTSLAPGQSTTCTATGTVQTGEYHNVATLTASADGFTFQLTDENFYFGSCDPESICPANINVTNDPGLCGAVVNYPDPVCPDFTVTQTGGPPSGSLFPVGSTTITYEITGEESTTICSFKIIVEDNEAPEITCPDNITVNNDPGICGAVVTYDVPVGTDNCPGQTTVKTAGLGSGATFPVGTTTETYTVTDANGFTADCSFTVTVVDNEAPVIIVEASQELWPPNHKYVSFDVADMVASATDNCDGDLAAQVVIASGDSDEPENGSGDGNTVDDIDIAPDCLSVKVRSERKGNGNGRVYTINLAVTDAQGNLGTGAFIITVPKSKNGNPAVDDGPAYSVTSCGSSLKPDISNLKSSVNLVSPNPSKDEIFLNLQSFNEDLVTIEIYDIQGKSMFKKVIRHDATNRNKIDISSYQEGVYHMIAIQGEARITTTFIKVQ